ncbi:hypothetical protein HU200_009348 [Digitaria exilis]|uniref:PI-PLC X domain-containing protein n=1 Tax=Digitaria exilis TaxID=1010633 RepID=A0A835FLU3_9POAL|nr:hypothetical protein HU200_009348 [Digitaria exilis]
MMGGDRVALPQRPRRLAAVVAILAALCSPAAVVVSARKVGQSCALDRNCDAGLHCETCVADGNVRPRCTRVVPVDPQTKAKDLPFNRYAWLTTHNSFARLGQRSQTGVAIATPWNQQDTVTEQLNVSALFLCSSTPPLPISFLSPAMQSSAPTSTPALPCPICCILVSDTGFCSCFDLCAQNGVRGLMLDMYDFRNDIWLCHSFGGICQNFTAFQPAVNVLREVERFLSRNTAEVVTIFVEDYVESPMGLTRVLNASGLLPYMFPVWRMPKSGGDWPRLSDMVRDNHRLLVFTSKAAKEAAEGIAYEWRYVVENQCASLSFALALALPPDKTINAGYLTCVLRVVADGTKGMVKGTCHNRAESAAMNDLSRSLVLVNYFRDLPNFPEACKDNSAALMDLLTACHDKSGDRWANFIAVDFYKRSDRGGAAEATDKANGGLVNGTCTTRHGKTPKGIFNASSDAAAWRPPPVLQWQRLVLLPVVVFAVLLRL